MNVSDQRDRLYGLGHETLGHETKINEKKGGTKLLTKTEANQTSNDKEATIELTTDNRSLQK